MSNIKELIREKIDAFYADYKAKLHQNADSYYLGIIDGLDMAERILDTLPDEPVSEDLEEAAAFEYERTRNDLDARSDNEVARRAFKAGAEWMKRKIMDEAYEVEVQEVYQDDDGIHCCVSVGTDYNPGTIVYVITIPKEDAE